MNASNSGCWTTERGGVEGRQTPSRPDRLHCWSHPQTNTLLRPDQGLTCAHSATSRILAIHSLRSGSAVGHAACTSAAAATAGAAAALLLATFAGGLDQSTACSRKGFFNTQFAEECLYNICALLSAFTSYHILSSKRETHQSNTQNNFVALLASSPRLHCLLHHRPFRGASRTISKA